MTTSVVAQAPSLPHPVADDDDDDDQPVVDVPAVEVAAPHRPPPIVVEVPAEHPPPAHPGPSSIILNWHKIILEYCFAASATFVVVKTGKGGLDSALEYSYSLAILLAVVALVAGKLMAPRLPRAAAAVERGGIVMGGAGFLLAITAPFHPYLKWGIWAVYAAASLLFIILY